ncbi:MAG: ABC transporter substrate-binding protein [Oscillospiraceae bacterium]|nr:ABC transporter substrate-binding protein [Oscillospiraceae bacterium]
MKALRGLIPILLILCILTACGSAGGGGAEVSATPNAMASPEETKSSGEFTLPYFALAGLNPYTCANSTNRVFFPLIWESLFHVDNTFHPVPILCESYEAGQDGASYTLKLRDSVSFSDGTALSAADVVYSLNMAKASGSQYSARLSGISGVRAEGRGTVLLTLSAPNGDLPVLLDFPIVKENSLEGTPVGTGPYAFTETRGSYALKANAGWWQKAVLPLNTIRLCGVTTPDQLVYGMRTYELDLVTTDFTGISAPGYSGDYQVWDYPTANMVYLGFNLKSGALTDAGLRRALSMGVDRTAIVSSCFFRHGQAAALPVSPCSGYYDESLAKTLSYSPQNMENALKSAGYLEVKDTDGDGTPDETVMSPLTLRLLVCSDNQNKVKAAQAVQQNLETVGIRVTRKELPFAEYESALKNGGYDLYLAEAKLTADFDLSALLGSGGTLNFGGYQSAQADVLLSEWKVSSGGQRKDDFKKLYQLLASDAPILPLLFKSDSVLTHREAVSGLAPTEGSVFSGLADWKFS